MPINLPTLAALATNTKAENWLMAAVTPSSTSVKALLRSRDLQHHVEITLTQEAVDLTARNKADQVVAEFYWPDERALRKAGYGAALSTGEEPCTTDS